MTTFGQLEAGAEFHLEGGKITFRKCKSGRPEALVQHDPEARLTGTSFQFGIEKPVIQGRPTKPYSPFDDPPEYHESFS